MAMLYQNRVNSAWTDYIGFFEIPSSRFYETVGRFASRIGVVGFDKLEPQYIERPGSAHLAVQQLGKQRGLVEIRHPGLGAISLSERVPCVLKVSSLPKDNLKILEVLNGVTKINPLPVATLSLQAPQLQPLIVGGEIR